MNAVLLAVSSDVEAAERARLALVYDGFPTDRVDLATLAQPGRAECQPARSAHERFAQYVRTPVGLDATVLRAGVAARWRSQRSDGKLVLWYRS